MSQIRNIQLLLVLSGILLLAGCQNDSAEPAGGKQETMVNLIPITTNYVDAQRMGTRADTYDPPTGYVPYDSLYPTTLPPHRTIGVFLTPEKQNSLGNFIYQGKDSTGTSFWQSTVYVTTGTIYYIYGYMPREDSETATISPKDGNYANGATLNINNYTTLTSADVCAIVGVRNASEEEKTSHVLHSPLNLGFFTYEGQNEGNNNIFVLLKHIYAGIHIRAFIGEKYHKMRDIEIKRLRLQAKNIPDYVNLTLDLTANSTGADITFVGAPYNGNGEVTLTKTNNTSVDFQGWNLVGNPFQQTAFINRDFFVMKSDGTEIIPGEGTEVGPMQGIFVIAATDGETMTFSTDPINNGKGLVINVHKNRGDVIDRAIVRFSEGHLLPKFMLNESHTKLYIPQNDKEYAVVSADNKTNEMPLNFKAAEEGTYTLRFNTQDVETGYLHLIDNLTGDDVDLLANPSYTFDARLTDYTSRFRLVFNETFTDVNENVNNGSFAIINNGNLIINNVEGTATLEMIDITGRIISAETINGSYNKAVKVKAGVYTLRLIQGESIRTQKVVVE